MARLMPSSSSCLELTVMCELPCVGIESDENSAYEAMIGIINETAVTSGANVVAGRNVSRPNLRRGF